VAGERPKTVNQIAKEIRMQKVQAYEAKILAAKLAEEQERNDLLLNILPVSDKAAPALVDDATDTNSPGNSDNDDPTINDDEEEDADEPTETNHDELQLPQPTSPPGSPLSILSMNTKPALIHPPRSISRVNDGGDSNHNESVDGTDQQHSNPLGILCGCI
jgi:hypothetical protein